MAPKIDTTPNISALLAQGLARHLDRTQPVDRPPPVGRFSEGASEEFKALIPPYNLDQLRRTFPQVREIDIESFTDVETGSLMKLVAILKDGVSELRVELGVTPPADTEKLIECIKAHLRDMIDLDKLGDDEVFDGFE